MAMVQSKGKETIFSNTILDIINIELRLKILYKIFDSYKGTQYPDFGIPLEKFVSILENNLNLWIET